MIIFSRREEGKLMSIILIQVVTLAVYSFFIATLMGRQLVGDQKDLYVPVFAFLQV